MNYIVFDLEWNQSPYGKDFENPNLPFEIIEIGAAKLNSEFQMTETFHRIIRPHVYRRLHHRIREVIPLREKDLEKGVSFQEALLDFLSFAGSDSIFVTWGPLDLYELQRNMKYHELLHLMPGPMHFYDAQKQFAIQYETMKSRRSLGYAVEYLHFEEDLPYHAALSDAIYTARVFATLDPSIILAYDSIDVFQNPQRKEDEIYAVYNGYTKYISREFANRDEVMKDREVTSTRCCICEHVMRKKVRWFSSGSKNYYAMGICPSHGLQRCKIRCKHNADGHLFIVKTIRRSSEYELQDLKEKKEEIQKKKKEEIRKKKKGQSR